MRTLIVASGVDMFHICLNSAWAVAVSRKAVGRTVHWRYSLFLWVVNRFYILRIPQRSFVCMETGSYCYKPNEVNKSLYNIKGKIESLKFKILFVVFFFFGGEGGRGVQERLFMLFNNILQIIALNQLIMIQLVQLRTIYENSL